MAADFSILGRDFIFLRLIFIFKGSILILQEIILIYKNFLFSGPFQVKLPNIRANIPYIGAFSPIFGHIYPYYWAFSRKKGLMLLILKF